MTFEHCNATDELLTGLFINVINIPVAFGKYVAWSFISETDGQTHSCLVSFQIAIFTLRLLCWETNFHDDDVMQT